MLDLIFPDPLSWQVWIYQVCSSIGSQEHITPSLGVIFKSSLELLQRIFSQAPLRNSRALHLKVMHTGKISSLSCMQILEKVFIVKAFYEYDFFFFFAEVRYSHLVSGSVSVFCLAVNSRLIIVVSRCLEHTHFFPVWTFKWFSGSLHFISYSFKWLWSSQLKARGFSCILVLSTALQ